MSDDLEKEMSKRIKEETGAPLFRVADKLARPAISLYLAQIDLEEISECLNRAEQNLNGDEVVFNALWRNIIITYGKLFAKSNDGFTSLDRKNFVSDSLVDTHNQLISARNSFIAHRGNNHFERSLLFASMARSEGKFSFSYTIPTVTKVGHLISEVSKVKDLVTEVKKRVEGKLTKKLKGIDSMLWRLIEESGLLKVAEPEKES